MGHPHRSTLTVALVESPVPGRLARRVRRAARGNGPGATLTPRPGPTPHLPAGLHAGPGRPQTRRQAHLHRGQRRCGPGRPGRPGGEMGPALRGDHPAVEERLGGVHPVPGLRHRDPHRNLLDERDRVAERPLPAGGQSPRPFPHRAGGAKVPLPGHPVPRPHRHPPGPVGHAVETGTQRFRHHLQRPLPGRGGLQQDRVQVAVTEDQHLVAISARAMSASRSA